MKELIRVLHVLATMDMGGIENFLMNIYRNIDREKIQFDFVINDRKKVDIFEKEIAKLGGRIYKIPAIVEKGHFTYIRALREILKKNNYKIVHSHYNAISGIILNEARKCGIENRISHSHIALDKSFKYKGLSGIYKRYSKSLINKNATLKFACSKEAGEWLYGDKKFQVINNGIIAKNYIFNNEVRRIKREELGIKEYEIIIGHIGRFQPQKNHKFIIDVFYELLKLDLNYKLILVGDGELKKSIEDKVKLLGVEDKVLFLGIRQDVNELLQVFDLFLFPSLYEGLPVAMIEVQASGLQSFISDTISKEVDLECNLIKVLSLNQTAKEWAYYIDKNKIYKRENTVDKIKQAGYDSEENVKEIEKLYLRLGIGYEKRENIINCTSIL